MNKAFLIFSFFLALFTNGYTQSASGSSRTVSYERLTQEDKVALSRQQDSVRRVEDSILRVYHRRILMPENVLFLLAGQRGEDAEKAYKKFRDTLPKKGNAFYIDFLDKEFFGKMATYGASPDRRSYYKKKNDAMLVKLKKKYPNEPLVIWYEVDDIEFDDSVSYNMLRLYDKMVSADSTYLPTYAGRAKVLFRLGYTKEACKDINRLPESVRREIPESIRCVDASTGH